MDNPWTPMDNFCIRPFRHYFCENHETVDVNASEIILPLWIWRCMAILSKFMETNEGFASRDHVTCCIAGSHWIIWPPPAARRPKTMLRTSNSQLARIALKFVCAALKFESAALKATNPVLEPTNAFLKPTGAVLEPNRELKVSVSQHSSYYRNRNWVTEAPNLSSICGSFKIMNSGTALVRKHNPCYHNPVWFLYPPQYVKGWFLRLRALDRDSRIL